MKLTVLSYQCDNCGLCCRNMVTFANRIDAAREPRIASECRRVKVGEEVKDLYLLNTLPESETAMDVGPCRFHTGTGCGIYGSRPNKCVGFEAGSPDCQSLRRAGGLEPLQLRSDEIDQDMVTFQEMPEMAGQGLANGQKSVG